jgi:two-component system chemotaxis sensor kinase CheA
VSVDREALRARLRALFVDELDEHVQTMNQGLVALEQGRPPAETEAVVHELFRAAHSLKGAAQSAGIDPLGALLHQLEDALARLRDHSLAPDPWVLSPLFAAADAIAAAGRHLRGGADVSRADLEPVLRDLGRLTSPAAPPAFAAAGDEDRSVSPEGQAVAPPEVVTGGGRAPVERGLPRRDAVVRVPVARLEALLNQAGEVLLAAQQVDAVARGLTDLSATVAAGRRVRSSPGPGTVPGRGTHGPGREAAPGLHESLDRAVRSAAATSRLLSSLSQALADSVRRIRMLPLTDGLDGLERTVRDLARAQRKEARLIVDGGHLEVERPILEATRDAVLHLVRNAVDHGIESPGERSAAGKLPAGTITVSAALAGNGVTIVVSDDGRGFDVGAIRAAAERAGVGAIDGDDGPNLAHLAFAPGVSTAPAVTDLSGRGVGLDAVRSRVEGVGGAVRLDSEAGHGSRVVLALPLALSAVRVLCVSVAGETVALPTGGVRRVLRPAVSDLRPVEGRDVLPLEDRSVPVVPLAEALGFPTQDRSQAAATFVGVVVGAGDEQAILAVDAVLGEQEVVMKPVADGREPVPGILGATILETGRVALILNPATCVRAGLTRTLPSIVPSSSAGRGPSVRRRVLLAEDSLTTRALERSILEAAGYDVIVAVDGAEAWRLLQDHDVDIVVTDVEMPGMDGFALCDAIKRSARFQHVPVVLVTSLGRETDRSRGVEVGADAYIAKSDFEQAVLLDAVERLL